MGHEIYADRSQLQLLPACLEDWVGEDHPARFLRAFVESLDLDGAGFEAPETDVGRPQYSRELLLSAWLYGYMHKIRSSRELERAVLPVRLIQSGSVE